MFCAKCGQLMLESDYDFYCDRDEILVRKKEAPPPPTFGEGESIVKMLVANDADHRRILANTGVFSEIVLTNRRIMLLEGRNLEFEIPLTSVLEAMPSATTSSEMSTVMVQTIAAGGPLLLSLTS
jgi:hypothetical protein